MLSELSEAQMPCRLALCLTGQQREQAVRCALLTSICPRALQCLRAHVGACCPPLAHLVRRDDNLPIFL